MPGRGQRGRPQAGRLLSSRPLQLEVLPGPPTVVTSTPAPKAEPAIIPATMGGLGTRTQEDGEKKENRDVP